MKPHKLTGHIQHIEYSASSDVIMMYIQIDQGSLDAEHIYTTNNSRDGLVVRPEPFQAGQFILLSTSIDDKQVKRSYSIATTPTYYLATGLIGFSIKRVEGGVFSTRATQQAKTGDMLHLTGPLGHMVDDAQSSNYLFISVGSGLSPIRSLYHDIIVEKKLHMKAAFLHGERYFADVLPSVHETYTQIHQNNDPDICTQFFLSQDTHNIYTTGRIQAGLEQALAHLDALDISCFLCGKPEMVADVVQILLDKGVAKERIKFEKY